MRVRVQLADVVLAGMEVNGFLYLYSAVGRLIARSITFSGEELVQNQEASFFFLKVEESVCETVIRLSYNRESVNG
jgi:hypothetical protein